MAPRAVAASALLGALLAGCSAEPATPLPPVAVEDVVPVYEDRLEELGVVLTDRGGLVDLRAGYESSPDGTHLALYVAPVEEQGDEAYARGLVEITELFATDVFERWPELESFDVCQEVHTGEFGEEAAPTRTQVAFTREAAAAIDWSDATVQDLLDAARGDDESYVRMDTELQDHLGLDG